MIYYWRVLSTAERLLRRYRQQQLLLWYTATAYYSYLLTNCSYNKLVALRGCVCRAVGALKDTHLCETTAVMHSNPSIRCLELELVTTSSVCYFFAAALLLTVLRMRCMPCTARAVAHRLCAMVQLQLYSEYTLLLFYCHSASCSCACTAQHSRGVYHLNHLVRGGVGCAFVLLLFLLLCLS